MVVQANEAKNRVAALRDLFVRADLADALEDLDRDPLLGDAGQEPRVAPTP
jgi:hypothetical protein